ncbi:hypothetical protein EHQ94_07205 [Leptospira meyeri]|uniref:SH3 domain-containing protein n=1 Tax=Leptospira meyeri TaxID=29508 RepID=UPI00108383D9|nr:SH3 domain-containing protein [Leptospira meyeri]TGM63204.1 hypothetical protein EHQ93_09110 [Leptospira meyeri]TGM70305.1 hypothetical protein EHQ94_07205 [Leptospira meyeri]
MFAIKKNKRIRLLLLLFICLQCQKTTDPQLLAKIEKEGQDVFLLKGFSAPLLEEPKLGSAISAEIFFDSKFQGIVTRFSQIESWVQVATDTGKIGWIPLENVKINEYYSDAYPYLIFADSVNIYSEENVRSEILGKLKLGDQGLYYLEESKFLDPLDWITIQWKGRKAYIQNNKNNLTTDYNVVGVSAAYAIVKDFPNPKANTIGKLSHDEMVSQFKLTHVTEFGEPVIYEENSYFSTVIGPDHWIVFLYNGKLGFLKPNSVKYLEQKRRYKVTGETIQIREEPNLDAKVVGSIKQNTTFSSWDETNFYEEIDGIKAKWVSITHKGKKAWVFGGNLQKN